MRRTRASAVTLLLVLAAPLALGAWASKGEIEPDTTHDAGWVWNDPPTGQFTSAVYFNGFAGAWAGSATPVNPNHELLGARVHAVPYAPSALLGIWTDCNLDGYVGEGATGAAEYSAMLLPLSTPCPATTDPRVLAHNDGRWVQELLPIGYDDVRTSRDENPFHIQDQAARVWADWGAPGAPPTEECGDVPLPRGTLRTTGGLVGLVDCRLGHRGLGTWNALAEAAGAGSLSFGDAPHDRPEESGSPLNVRNPWGHEWDDPMVSVVDCEAPANEVGPADPTDNGSGNGRLHRVTVPVIGFSFNATDHRGRFVNTSVRPLDPRADPSGSPSGTINGTQAETADCQRDDRDSVLTYEGERRGSDGAGPYVLETSAEAVDETRPRARTDFTFTYEEGAREPDSLVAPLLGRRWQNDAGTGAATLAGTWVATGRDTRLPFLSRGDLGAAPVTVITFYAYVSTGLAETLGMRFAHGAALYGTDCEVYECDRQRWWRNADGVSVVPRDPRLGADPANPAMPAMRPETELGVRSGQLYQLRDTDCYDQSVGAARGAAVHWGVLTSTSCAP